MCAKQRSVKTIHPASLVCSIPPKLSQASGMNGDFPNGVQSISKIPEPAKIFAGFALSQLSVTLGDKKEGEHPFWRRPDFFSARKTKNTGKMEEGAWRRAELWKTRGRTAPAEVEGVTQLLQSLEAPCRGAPSRRIDRSAVCRFWAQGGKPRSKSKGNPREQGKSKGHPRSESWSPGSSKVLAGFWHPKKHQDRALPPILASFEVSVLLVNLVGPLAADPAFYPRISPTN